LCRLGDKDSNLDKRSQNAPKNQPLSTFPQHSAGSECGTTLDSAQSDSVQPRFAAVAEPTDGELEWGILDALMKGLDGVAKTLAARLDQRRRERAGNVVDLDGRRR
jgi:hypothetical protein